MVALRSQSGRTTTRSMITPVAATADNSESRRDRQRQAERLPRAVGDHAAHHHERALGEVHDAAGVVDDAEADTDQAIDAADGDTR